MTPGGALGAVGLSEVQEQLYRLLIAGSGGSVVQIASQAGLPVDEVAAALEELQAKGFVNRSASRNPHYRPTPPMLVTEILVREREQRLQRARMEAAKLQEAFESSTAQDGFLSLVEVVTGRSAVVQRVMQLQAAAEQEIQVLDRPPYASTDRKVTDSEVEHLQRGVRARVIYDTAALDLPGQPAALRMLADEGEDARVLSGVPLKLMIADEHIAIVPLSLKEAGVDGIVVMRASPLIVAMRTLFDSLWRMATPVGLTNASRNDVPGEQLLLELLSTGMTDRAIGYQLGVSARTVQRRVRRLLDLSGARSRTQLLLERSRPQDRPKSGPS
jgi:sugar-specific transcriptional regulator TrmB